MNNITSKQLDQYTPNPSEPKDAKVERPWWAISKVAKKAWVTATLASGVLLLGATVSAVLIPNPVAGVVAAVAAVSLSVLLGVGLFETVRKKGVLPEKLQRLADAIHANAVEVICFIGRALLYPTALFRSDPKVEKLADGEQQTKRPVLLVHGYMDNASGWAYTKARFKHANIGPVYTINLGNPVTTKSIKEYSRMVQEKVDAIVAKTGCDKVVVVGHSMGGLVGSEAATKLDTGNHIDELITLGSPMQGTHTATFGPGKCAKEMRHSKKNTFISDLKEQISNYKGKIHHFRSKSDVVILPNKSASLGGENTSMYADHGHLYYTFSDSVIDEMITRIRKGDQELNRTV